MSILLEHFKELREDDLHDLCPNEKTRHNLLRFIVSMHSPETKFSEKLLRYCEVHDFVIGSGLTRKSVICLTKGKGEVVMAEGKGKKTVNLELIGGLSVMIVETAEKLAENGSVTIEFDGENLTHSEGEASKTAKKTAKAGVKPAKEEEDDEEEEAPKKSSKKSATKKTAAKTAKKTPKKKALEMESLEEYDEKATVEDVDAVVEWATEQTLEFELSSKPKITIKRIRDAAIAEWSDSLPDEWSEDED